TNNSLLFLGVLKSGAIEHGVAPRGRLGRERRERVHASCGAYLTGAIRVLEHLVDRLRERRWIERRHEHARLPVAHDVAQAAGIGGESVATRNVAPGGMVTCTMAPCGDPAHPASPAKT